MAKDRGLTRPELSVLIAYGKMVLKDAFNIPEITENPYHGKLLVNAFPPVLRDKYPEQMEQHPLRGEIIATKLTNNIVNDMGLNFVFRMQEETGATVDEIADAYAVVKGIFNIDPLWRKVEALDNVIDADLQLRILESARRIMRRTARWYIRHGNKSLGIHSAIEAYRGTFDNLASNMQNYLVADEYASLQKEAAKLVDKGVPEDIATQVSSFSNLFSSLDLAQIDETDSHDTSVIAKLYFQLGAKLELHWFLAQITNQNVSNHWQALARASYREELDWQQRSITLNLLQSRPDSKDADEILQSWMDNNQALLKRWYHMMSEFKTSSTHEFAKFSVALRELMLLSAKSSH